MAHAGDVIIEPDVKPFVWDDFTKTPEMVAVGEAAALAALPQIRAAIGGEKRDLRRIAEFGFR